MRNNPWTGDDTLSSPGEDGSIIYELQPIRDRPVGGVGDFHTVREGINSGAISVFVPGSSELYIWDGLRFWEWTLSSPDDGYFMYDPRPMSDQRSDKKAIL